MRRREWLALPLLLRAAGERFRLQRRSGRWMFVSPEGRPFFPLWGGNARQEELAVLEARRWPEVIPSPPAERPKWGVAYRLPESAAVAMRQLRTQGAENEAKSRWVDFLKERYEYAIARVNEAYGIESTSFSDLLVEGFGGLDVRRRAVAQDDAEFYAGELERFGEGVCLPDPRSGRPVIWLDRFEAQPPEEVVAMRAPESGREAEQWLLSREKEMADWMKGEGRR